TCTFCGKCSQVCAYHALAVLPGEVLVFPELCHGCGACAYLCPEKAISEAKREIGVVDTGYVGKIEFVQGKLNVGEAMAVPLIRAVKAQSWRNGTTIIDVPPGTACPVVESIKDSNFCLLVTEPTPFGLWDLALAVDLTRKVGVPCGVVINRDMPGYDDTEDYCNRERIPILMRIPYDRQIATRYSRGITLAEGLPEWKERLVGLLQEIQSLAGVKL
ncbi:MAG: 4Fe-4S binding protein, partial [Chloroflexota bacterium]